MPEQPKNLDLYEDLLALETRKANHGANELSLARRLINTLQDVAIIAADAKLHVHYANQYAMDIFNLDPKEVENGKGKLPRTVKNQIKENLSNTSSPFVVPYQSGSALRSLQVFHKRQHLLADNTGDFVLHMHDITARVGIETKLRQTERLLRNVIDTSPDFITVKDEKNRWLLSNKSTLSLFKIPKKQYQYKTDAQISSLIDPCFKECFRQFKALDEQAWQSDYSVQQQVVVRMPNGGEKVYDVFKIAIYNEDGSRQGLLTIGRDITENKLAEHHLRDRGAILDALITSDWLLNGESTWESVTPKVLAQIGIAANFNQVSVFQNQYQTKGIKSSNRLLTWQAPTHHTSKRPFTAINFRTERFADWLKELPEGQAVFGSMTDFPESISSSLKRFGIKSIMIVPLFSAQQWWGNLVVEQHQHQKSFSKQEVGAMMAIARSLGSAIEKENTDQRIAQAQIAFNSASEGIIITDADAKVTAVNQGFTDITGYTEKDVIGKAPTIFNASSHQIWDAIDKHGKWRGETKSFKKNGEEYQELLTLTSVKNHQNEVINYVAVFSDISEIKASQNKLNQLVNHDTLTGLPNRRLLNELLDHAIKRSEREVQKVAILFIDLDRFKAVNDSLGHQVGDQLLIEVSARISQCIRDSDVVARLGGDEFLVMMNQINHNEDAALVAQKIIQSLQREFIISGKEIFIGASIGISISLQDGSDVESLIKAADIAMYQVKNRGKNNYCFYTPELNTNAVEQFNMESSLRHALAQDAFQLYFQPQVSIATGEIVGAEALLRWNHPELGLLAPDSFISLAEETGLIIPIGQWVLREVATAIVSLQAQDLSLESLSVNVSAVQVLKGNFADTVYGILIETDCDPSSIELEITESTVMQNTEFVIDTFNHIKNLGIRLAIDDFGTGYSSLSNLKRLPLDKVKIDHSFVTALPDDLDDAVIANTINAMAHSLGFDVIAEGVENQAQADFLMNIGCHKAQGYLYGAPMDYQAFIALLKTKKQTTK